MGNYLVVFQVPLYSPSACLMIPILEMQVSCYVGSKMKQTCCLENPITLHSRVAAFSRFPFWASFVYMVMIHNKKGSLSIRSSHIISNGV